MQNIFGYETFKSIRYLLTKKGEEKKEEERKRRTESNDRERGEVDGETDRQKERDRKEGRRKSKRERRGRPRSTCPVPAAPRSADRTRRQGTVTKRKYRAWGCMLMLNVVPSRVVPGETDTEISRIYGA